VTSPAWRSPRKDAETAIQMGERWIDEYEIYLSRPLTPAEMAEVHGKARLAAERCGRQARAAADRTALPQDDAEDMELSL
jgi:hypothetical protein